MSLKGVIWKREQDAVLQTSTIKSKSICGGLWAKHICMNFYHFSVTCSTLC